MFGQLLPITGQRSSQMEAASALVEAASSRADDAVRRARADLRWTFAQLAAAQARERELTSARDRLRDLSEILSSARPPAMRPASIACGRSARCSTWTPIARPRPAERARAQAALAAFSPSRSIRRGSSRSCPIRDRSPPLPTVDALIERAIASRGELAAFRKEVDAANLSVRAADRRKLPEPEVIAGTKSSLRRHRQRRDRCRPSSRCSITERSSTRLPPRVRAKQKRRQPHSVDRCARRLNRFMPLCRSDATPLRDIGEAPSRAPISSSASRRSATTRASAAFWSCSMPIAPAPPPGSVRRCSRPPSVKLRSNWNS